MPIASYSDVSGLVLWMDPNQEAGVNGAAAPATFTDRSGSGNTGTKVGTVTMTVPAINGRKGFNFNAVGAYSLANNNTLTAYTVFFVGIANNTNLQVMIGTTGASYIAFQNTFGIQVVTAARENDYRRTAAAAVAVCYGVRKSAAVGTAWFNGGLMNRTANAILAADTQVLNQIGGFSPFFWSGVCALALIYNRALTDAEVIDVTDLINSQFALTPKTSVICDGNSLTSGTGGTPYPTQLESSLSQNTFEIFNFGVAGQTWAVMSADYSTQIATLFDSRRPQNILVAWEGTNTIIGGATAAQTQAAAQAYCTAGQVTGFKVILGTTIAAGTGVMTAGQETIRTTSNTWENTNFRTFACAVAGFAANAAFDTQADAAAGPNYGADHLHLLTAGYGLIAGIASPVISGTLTILTYTGTGPAVSTVGSDSTAFTVTLAESQTVLGSQPWTVTSNNAADTLTPSVGSPSVGAVTVTPVLGQTGFTFTLNAATAGARTITFTNAQGWTNPAPLALTANAPAPVISSGLTDSGTEGDLFAYQITGSNTPTSYSASGLPDGLTVDTDTGLISGTPTESGTFNILLGATNDGGTGTATLVLTVEGTDVTLPTCACVEAQPQIDKLRSIYCVTRALAGSPDSLPDCACVHTVNDLLDNIYCSIVVWGEL